MPDLSPQTTISKLVGAGVAIAAAWAAQQAIGMIWKAVSGHLPPRPEDDDGRTGLGEVAAAAAITGAVAGLARVLATRGTATTLR